MNAYDLYTFYIEPADLKGQAIKVKIVAADVKETFNPRTKSKEKQIVLRFAGKQKVLGLNKTRAGQMIEIAGTPDFERWVGIDVIIRPGKQSGKDTVVIEAAPQSAPVQTQAPTNGHNQPQKIEINLTRLAELKALAETDIITAYTEAWKAAGLDNQTQQAILKEYTGDFAAAFEKIIKDYAYIIG
jgi:hypothetical protein